MLLGFSPYGVPHYPWTFRKDSLRLIKCSQMASAFAVEVWGSAGAGTAQQPEGASARQSPAGARLPHHPGPSLDPVIRCGCLRLALQLGVGSGLPSPWPEAPGLGVHQQSTFFIKRKGQQAKSPQPSAATPFIGRSCSLLILGGEGTTRVLVLVLYH